MPSFLKTGAAAREALAKAEAQTEAKKAAAGNVQRFWLPEGKSATITFLDGVLDEHNTLASTMYWEHQVKMNGHWRNWFVCTHETEPCPVCESGNQPSFVAAFTIIDHSEYTDRSGKVHRDEKRLFVCKRDTYAILQQKAQKKDGLRGWKVDVARIGERSANVGNDFDFIERVTLEDHEDFRPYDYEEVIKYLEASQLRELGFGDGIPSGGSSTPQYSNVDSGKVADAL